MVCWVDMSSFRNHQSVVLYCRTPSMLICQFCEVLFYTVKGRRHVYVVETVYIIHSYPHPNSRYEQIMQIFHPRHPVLMYLSSPWQVYSTEKLRSRNRHFSRYFHDSINRSKVALIFTGDSVLNRTLAEQVISSWIFDEFIICATIFLIPPTSALSLPNVFLIHRQTV